MKLNLENGKEAGKGAAFAEGQGKRMCGAVKLFLQCYNGRHVSLYRCQTHRMYSTKSEPQGKLWTLGDYVSGRFIDDNKCASLAGDMISGEVWEGGDTRDTWKLSTSHSRLL